MSRFVDQEAIDAAEDVEIIFRRFRRNQKTGELMDARRYGLKAWPIRVSHKRRPSGQAVPKYGDPPAH